MTKFEVNSKPNNLAIETGIQSKIEITIRTKPIITTRLASIILCLIDIPKDKILGE